MVSPNPRVLHIAQSTAGGIASYFEEIAPFQSERFGASNVAFVVPAGAAHMPSIAREQLVCFRSALRGPRALIDFLRTALGAVNSFRPDIVHLHSSFAGAMLRPLLKARRSRPRIVYCPHGWAFGMETAPAKQRTYALVERQLARMTDLIHVVSQSEFDLAARFGLPRGRMRVLANGIAPAPISRACAGEGPLRIAFIGRHDRQKGLDILLDVLARFALPNVHFDIIGDSIVSGEAQRARPDVSNATFHGWLPRAETMRILDQADALVMPSRWDAAPIVAIEAMRAGVPVIGSNRGAIPEIVEHEVGGLIFDLDRPDSLGALLQQLTREELVRLGKSAHERWQAHYVSDRMNARTCEAYEQLLRDARAPRGNDRQAVERATAPLREAAEPPVGSR